MHLVRNQLSSTFTVYDHCMAMESTFAFFFKLYITHYIAIASTFALLRVLFFFESMCLVHLGGGGPQRLREVYVLNSEKSAPRLFTTQSHYCE